jgi:hypothetical protein
MALRWSAISLMGCTKSTLSSEEKNMSPAKAQRRKGAKKTLKKRGSALRLCAFAGEIFFIEVLFVQSWVKP